MSTSVAGVLGERAEVAERVVEVAPAAVDRLRLRLHPDLERRARASGRTRGRSRRARRSARPATSRSVPPSGIGLALGVPGRELDVGLAQQRLLAQDRPRVRRQRRVAASRARSPRRSGPVFLSGSIVLTLPTGTPEIRTSASCASCVASANDACEAVALRLERDRAAERQPQEQQQAEARQREARPSRRCGRRRGRPCASAAARPAPGSTSGRSAAVGGVEQLDERAEQRVGLRRPLSSTGDVLAAESTTRPRRIGPCASCVAKRGCRGGSPTTSQNR